MWKYCLTLVLSCTVCFVHAQQSDAPKLDSFLNALAAHDKFMGSVAVTKNGTLVYARATGYADVAAKLPADGETKYRIGSISKTFTAALVFKAIESRQLALDQTLSSWFPGIAQADKITIRHMLSHRSGIHNFTANQDYLSWSTQPKTEKELVDIITKGGSDFEPGSRMSYSNSNYVLLTYILEKVFKQPYAKLLTTYICKPAGLTNTYLGGKIRTADHESNSYKFLGQWQLMPETDISVPLGAGGIVSTPADLTRFLRALFTGKIISRESVEQMKPVSNQEGLGLFPMPFGDKAGYGHNGGIDGFSSLCAYYPADDISFAITSNGANYDINNIAIILMSAAYGAPWEMPSFSAYAVTSEELDQYTGVYASKDLPVKITFTRQDNTLIGQVTGQTALALEPTGKHQFRIDRVKAEMTFDPAAKTMTLKQAGRVMVFTKE